MQNKFIWPAVFVICSVIVSSGIYLGLKDSQLRPATETHIRELSSDHIASNTDKKGDIFDQIGPDKNDIIVYVTRTGACYHRGTCRYLSKSKIPMKLSEARQRYRPCSKCNPPQ